jgi:hypothetical protein
MLRLTKQEPDLTVPNYPDIYVVGDLAAAVDAKGQTFAGSVAGSGAGRAVRGQGNLAESKRSAETPSLSVPRPRLTSLIFHGKQFT